MQAWQVHELGDPIDRLILGDVDNPEPSRGQLLVDVDAVGLAFPDVLQCRGEYQVKPPLPFTPGGETSGRVAALGDGVEGFEIGERVGAMGGGLAEQVAVSAGMAFAVPKSLSQAKAAAVPLNYGTTWFALHNRAGLAEGETLLVTGRRAAQGRRPSSWAWPPGPGSWRWLAGPTRQRPVRHSALTM